ncbi:MAG TPA: phosphotransferase family protein [Kofleriaceae bacterium]|nr:phosphotransferase family protein [Kofleriaceae bacterium]
MIGEDQAKPVREGEELPLPALKAFLESEVGLLGPVRVEQFPGGHSNLTYLVHHGDREYVLRRPPFGSKVKSAHDMGREVAVLSKLAPVYTRAPHVIAYCDSPDVMGAPFYLMERRRGIILRKDLPPNLDHARIAHLCDALVDALVDLHAVDYRAAGLGDFGKPAGYVERQVKGWSERYIGSQTDDIPAMTEVAAWLATHMPADGPPSLIHNDFKFDNVIFDPSLDQIVGVLDWEMATIGDPLMDVGTSLSYWMQADDAAMFQSPIFGITMKPGMLRRADIAARYFDRSGRQTDHLVFYFAFGLFKTAVILQQIYYRYAKGLTQDARFAPFIMVVRGLADHARASIERMSL